MRDEQASDVPEISIEEIIQKIKDEAARRKTAETGTAADNGGGCNNGAGAGMPHMSGGGGLSKINFPAERINLLINNSRSKSAARDKIPRALNRFPVNKSKLLQKIILKFYELLFREQRGINNEILDVLQELSGAQSETARRLGETAEALKIAAEVRDALSARLGGLEGKMGELEGKVGSISGAQSETAEALKAAAEVRDALSARLGGLEGKAGELEGKAEGLAIYAGKTDIEISALLNGNKTNAAEIQKTAAQLDEIRKKFIGAFPEENHIFDAMYAAFEETFRGTRQDIKERQKAYLPAVKEAYDRTGGAPVIDAGCGRGEWLEILKENGINAKGIELNKIMAGICRGLNISVEESDIVAYLKTLPADTLSAVTGFHIIEHMPFKSLLSFLEESFRVLKPGGIAVYETPNPENLLVSGYTFYIDPFHIKPLAPVTMQFILKDRGFSNVEIKRLHKYSDYYDISEENKFINENFYNEMDYAIIGFK